jgi:hypothetical protein
LERRVVWDATCGKILLEIVLPQMLHDFEISCPVVARVFSSIYLSQYALSLPINHSSALEDVLQIIRYDASTSGNQRQNTSQTQFNPHLCT